jgi:hypothetical protein
VLEHCRVRESDCWFSLFSGRFLLTALPQRQRISIHIDLFTVTFHFNYTNEFRGVFDGTKYVCTFRMREALCIYCTCGLLLRFVLQWGRFVPVWKIMTHGGGGDGVVCILNLFTSWQWGHLHAPTAWWTPAFSEFFWRNVPYFMVQ